MQRQCLPGIVKLRSGRSWTMTALSTALDRAEQCSAAGRAGAGRAQAGHAAATRSSGRGCAKSSPSSTADQGSGRLMAAMVDLTIAGRVYQVACRDGEEENLRTAARLVDAKCREALAGLGTLSEARQFLFAALAARRPDDRRGSRAAAAGRRRTLCWSAAPKRSQLASSRLPTPLSRAAPEPIWKRDGYCPVRALENP